MAEPMIRRIRLRRTKGWRLPDGAVIVDRRTRWGNPFVCLREACPRADGPDGLRRCCIELYRQRLATGALDLAPLRGKDLACWCALCAAHSDGKPLGVACDRCAPCHADVLLEAANDERQ